MSELSAKILTRIEQVEPMVWDGLASRYAFCSHAWMQLTEQILQDSPSYYVLIEQGNQEIAAAAFFLMREEQIPIGSKIGRLAVSQFVKRFPLLICRAAPFSQHPGLMLPEGEMQLPALQLMSQKALEIAAHHRATSFILFDYLQSAYPVTPPYHLLSDMMEANTYLPIAWDSFEAYLSQLKKSAKKDYTRHTNRAADLGITLSAHGKITQMAQAVDLIRAVEQHHGEMPHPLTARLLHALSASNLPYCWITAQRGETLVGCGLIMIDEATRTGKLALLGLDYGEKYVYFQLVYAAIRQAIERRLAVLHGGSGAYDFKENLGFQRQTGNALAFASPLLILRSLIGRFV